MKLLINKDVLCRISEPYAKAYRDLFKSFSIHFKEEPDERPYLNLRILVQKVTLPEEEMNEFLEYLDMGVGTIRLLYVGSLRFELEVSDEGWN